MKETRFSATKQARNLLATLTRVQQQFASDLKISLQPSNNFTWQRIDWQREQGQCGGGWRLVAGDDPVFNTASINISQVHYEQFLKKPLLCATALSTIIHPGSPHSPSVHLHVSYTQLRSGRSYWRLMADLNPSHENFEDKVRFDEMAQEVLGNLTEEAKKQGEHYFFIPALGRNRGVSHYYLENYNSSCFEDDSQLAQTFANDMLGLLYRTLEKP